MTWWTYNVALRDIELKRQMIAEGRDINKAPVKQIYIHMDPLLQTGPACGLVALSMICSTTDQPKPVEYLMAVSSNLGFSIRGEMFSAKHLSILSKYVLDGIFDISHHSGGLNENKDQIVKLLLNGNLLLVPYDADRDNSPGCFKGHKAHWAVICGILDDSGKYYLIARQGKSSHVGIWSYESLTRSNLNLVEVSPDRIKENQGYVFHDIKDTLAGHYIVFKKRKNE